MARVLRMPELAEDPTEGVLSEWLVKECAAFAGAQSLATVETEKLLVRVEASEPGVLVKALVAKGATVDPGTPLAVLAEPDETVGDIDALLAELGLGEPRTRIVADALGLPVTPPPVPAPSPVPIAQLRLRETVRAQALLAVLDELNVEEEHVTVTDLVVKAVASAYETAALGDARRLVDVAVVVPTDPGVATPLVTDVGSLTVTGVHALLAAATARAAADRTPAGELEPGVITVVDLGAHGVAETSVDVTPTRRAVLGVGAVRDEAVVEGGVLVPGKVLAVMLCVDQELAGAPAAARWFAVLVELLEHPVRFLA